MRHFLLAALLILLSVPGKAQNRDHGCEWGIEVKPKFGMLVAHRSLMAHIPDSYPKALECTIFFNTKGQKSWHRPYKYPIVGATLFGGTVGNQQVLGDFFGGYGFIEFPFIRKKHYLFTGKLGTGLGYGTRVYDPVTNPKNAAVSTHFNAMVCVGLRNVFYFGDNSLSFSVDMTHFSNGANKTPNLGLNLPFLGIGYGRVIRKRTYAEPENRTDILLRKRSINVTAIVSSKQVFPSGGHCYPIFALNANYRKIYNAKTGLEAGIDLFSKQSVLDYKPEIPKTQLDILQVGTYLGYVLPLDKLHFILGMGIYVRDKYQPDARFYHRLGMRYCMTNHLILNLTLKSHWAKADYVEWGIGYSF